MVAMTSPMTEVERARCLELDRRARQKKWDMTQPCKDISPECRQDGGCLRCEADAGERCHMKETL